MQRDAPRHIRDIAHLYLSRVHAPRERMPRVVVAGMNPDVIPGFHAASIALAAAVGGKTVRIVEASGLPVSSGCFLGLDPSCWAPDGQSPAATVSAFERVSFVRSSGDGLLDVATPREPDDLVEIVHAPPWDAGLEHARFVDRLAGPRVVLYVAERDAPPRPWREWRDAGDVDGRVLFVARTGVAPEDIACAGVITRWQSALTDPLPVALRDPGSRLARHYHDLLVGLLAATGAGYHERIVHRHATIPIKSL